jgi:hypothetical protein
MLERASGWGSDYLCLFSIHYSGDYREMTRKSYTPFSKTGDRRKFNNLLND